MRDARRPVDTSSITRGGYVAITGAIAAGATTLSTVLHDRLHWTRYEDERVHTSNAFFQSAYADFPRWGFHSQVHFMVASAERHVSLRAHLDNHLPPGDRKSVV